MKAENTLKLNMSSPRLSWFEKKEFEGLDEVVPVLFKRSRLIKRYIVKKGLLIQV